MWKSNETPLHVLSGILKKVAPANWDGLEFSTKVLRDMCSSMGFIAVNGAKRESLQIGLDDVLSVSDAVVLLTARPATLADPNKPTLIADLIEPGSPNSSMANAHAEVAAIQHAYDAGLTNGQSMTIVVRGQEVCNFCRSTSNLIAAADRSGLIKLQVVETSTGKIYTWTRGSKGWD